MLNLLLVRIVEFCVRRRRSVIVAGFVIAIASAIYAAKQFSINTDVEALISHDLAWHQRQLEFSQAFPQQGITAVVTARTPEDAQRATNMLVQELARHPDLFRKVVQPDSGDFFERNGLLFEPLPEVKKFVGGLMQAQPFVGQLSADPSLRGVMNVLSFAAKGVQGGQFKLDQLVWPLSLAEQTLNQVLTGKQATFSWQELVQGHSARQAELRHFVEIEPVLDFSALQPGHKATAAIERAASDLKLQDNFGAKLALTGEVPMNDDQFSVIRQSALRDTLAALMGVLAILWLALRSWRIIAAVFFSLLVGLAVTAALGIAMVGSFNLLSVAFFVLFVGLGVDFGIQFSVRYRSERHEHEDLNQALRSAARKAGKPLALAAAATAVGFFAFLPTNYRGLSELGLIAGCGMLIAFLSSITLVPAMLATLNPPGETASIGFKGLAPIDRLTQRYRVLIIAVTIIGVVAGTPLLLRLPFDFNPINLQNPESPSVVTYRELQRSSVNAANGAEIIASSLAQANATAERLMHLPEVARVLTASSLIPDDQDQKIQAIKSAAQTVLNALNPPNKAPEPSDQEVVSAIRNAAQDLSQAAGDSGEAGAEHARRVATLLTRLADADPSLRGKVGAAVIPPLIANLDRLRRQLDPQPITVQSLPQALARNWLLPNGRARIQTLAKGDTTDSEVLKQFATAVLKVEPSATGPAIGYYESDKTISRAFLEAGALALAAIAILLFVALGRVSDVLLTLVPLVIAGAVTLQICVLSHFPLNFANVIALPLLLGVGVAFKIYYIMAWRAGKTGLLQSSLTRAVIFSAMTNAVAFGSMWSSSYPGMSSMGQLMFLSLICTMAAAVFFQPVLMGRPRQIKPDEPADKLGVAGG